jgi:hypothetical protein
MGHKALISPDTDLIFTPTELGNKMKPQVSAVVMNMLLSTGGYQVKVGKVWSPTDKAKGLYEVLDVGKKHGNGTPIKQIKWKCKVIEALTVQS